MDEFITMRGPGAPPIQVIFTDQDPAIAASLRTKMPDALHLWCIWHLLGKNLATNMKGYFSSEYALPPLPLLYPCSGPCMLCANRENGWSVHRGRV